MCDPHKDQKTIAFCKELDKCITVDPVFYKDKVDIHINPKIGADWQLREQQKCTPTRGQNKKD